jgi:hypothetical protein
MHSCRASRGLHCVHLAPVPLCTRACVCVRVRKRKSVRAQAGPRARPAPPCTWRRRTPGCTCPARTFGTCPPRGRRTCPAGTPAAGRAARAGAAVGCGGLGGRKSRCTTRHASHHPRRLKPGQAGYRSDRMRSGAAHRARRGLAAGNRVLRGGTGRGAGEDGGLAGHEHPDGDSCLPHAGPRPRLRQPPPVQGEPPRPRRASVPLRPPPLKIHRPSAPRRAPRGSPCRRA